MTEELKTPWWQRKWVIAVGLIVALGLVGALFGDGDTDEPVAAASDGDPQDDPDPEPESGPDPDASAQLACQHFRNVAADADAGVLSDDELREKVLEVHETGQVSNEPGISDGTESLLRAVTQDLDVTVPVTNLANACEDLGL